jgi:lipase chaperone LimK
MKKMKLLAPIGIALISVILVIFYVTYSHQNPSAESVIGDATLKKEAPAKIGTTLVYGNDVNSKPDVNLPKSLRGTQVDGGFRVDSDGNLIISIDNKRFFDYFLSTVGEESIAQITARIRGEIESKLKEPARSQALKELEQYLSYKAALADIEKQIGGQPPSSSPEENLARLKQRMQAIFDARNQYLSQEVNEAFYSQDEAVDKYSLASLEVRADTSLTEDQKQEKLLALESMLPEKIREQRKETVKYERYALEEKKMIEQHATPGQLYQFRAQHFGEQAAQRLAKLDQQRAEWNTRMAQYDAQKATLQKAGLSKSDYQEQLQALRQQNFSPIEIRRVDALDRIAASQAKRKLQNQSQ